MTEEKIKNYEQIIKEYQVLSKINNIVSKILSKSGNINEVAKIIKRHLDLHTCYISYDMNTKTDKAHVAGLSTSFGKWFNELTKKTGGIPFSFAKKNTINENESVTAAEYINDLKKSITLSPELYRPLIIIKNINELDINRSTMYNFLTSKLGEMRIIPMENNMGAMILIKKNELKFRQHELEFLETLAYNVSISINDIYHVYHDELGIKNELFLKKHLLSLKTKKYAIAAIKIEGLKQINDDYSREMGNKLIVKIEDRLFSFLLKANIHNPENLITREKGSIFKIVLPGLITPAKLKKILFKINDCLIKPYNFEDKENLILSNTIKIGACIREDDEKIDLFLDKADNALNYVRKEENLNFIIYNKEIKANIQRKKYIKKILRNIIKEKNHSSNDKLFFLLQKKVDVRYDEIIGYEALIRMKTEKYGIVMPDEFIKIAEEENLIIELDLWVVKEICEKIKNYFHNLKIPISINISRYHINNSNFVQELKNIFNEMDFYDYINKLKIEITESGLLNENGIETLKNLHSQLGLKISIDDIGKDNSNLHTVLILYLNNLVDTIKIDKKFVDKILKTNGKKLDTCENESTTMLDKKGCQYILSILKIFNGLFTLPDISRPMIICEGVEYKKQVDWLIQNNCTFFQGFYFGKPAPFEEVKKEIEKL